MWFMSEWATKQNTSSHAQNTSHLHVELKQLPRKIVDSKAATTAEAKRTLERAKEDELGEFQRRTLDYASKFSRISPAKAEKLVRELSDKFQLERRDAIQIANTMPRYTEELRTILTVKGKIIGASELQDILKVVNDYRD
jgi:DNA-directed RNA polymerase subunit F